MIDIVVWKSYDTAGPYPYRCSTRAQVSRHIATMLQFCEDAFGPGLATKSFPDTNAKWWAALTNVGLESVEFGFREEADRMMFICRF